MQLVPSTTYLFLIRAEDEVYRTVTLPVVLYGCETWSLILRNVG